MFLKGFSKKEIAILIILTATILGFVAWDTVVYINNYYKTDVTTDSVVDLDDMEPTEDVTEPVTEPATEEVTEPVTEPATEEVTEENPVEETEA